jgi:DNA polymerase delta subunit 1
VIASFDIECASEDGSFPDPKRKGDVVFQIATTFQRFGEREPYLRHLCNFGDCDPLEGIELVCVKSEADLIRRWTAVLRREDADVMVAWNSNGFDYQFIAERASRFGVRVEIGKLLQKESKLITSNLSSAAFGDNKLTYLQTPGIFDLDLMLYVKREYKLDSYKLDAVAEKYLDEHKLDMTPAQIFEAYRGGPADKARCGKYCVSWIVSTFVL